MKKQPYTASIKVLGQLHEAKGSSVREAIENLSVPLGKGIGILTLSKGKALQSKILTASNTMRLFSPSQLMREMALKNTANLFDL